MPATLQKPAQQQTELAFESHLPAGRQWFTVWELAGYWGFTPQHVIDLCNEGRFTFGVIGPVNFAGDNNKSARAATRIPRECVLAFLKANKQ